MTGARRIRASLAQSRKRELELSEHNRAVHDAARRARSEGESAGYRARDLEYTRICKTDSSLRAVNLNDPPHGDRIEVPLSPNPGVTSVANFDLFFEDARRYENVRCPRASFRAERLCWTDGHVLVQWWGWKFEGVH